jgi:translation initiation factor 1
MDLQDQLKNLFPDHKPSIEKDGDTEYTSLWIPNDHLLCKYEKRKGKPITIIEGYTGTNDDFKQLTREIKKQFSVGGSFKDDTIIIQGDYRDKIMNFLKDMGFKVKRVGG